MGILCRYLMWIPCHLSSMDRSLLFLRRVAGSIPAWYNWHTSCHILSFYHVRPIIFEKTIIKNFYVQMWESTVKRTWVLRNQLPEALSTWLFGTATAIYSNTIKQLFIYKFWWVFYPDNFFWLICTTRCWDQGSMWGHTLFLSELNFL